MTSVQIICMNVIIYINNKSVLLQSLGLFKITKMCKSALRMFVTVSHLGLGVKAVNIKE